VDMVTRVQAHQEAIQKPLHVVVAALIAALGPTTVQALTGTKDRSMPSKWARKDGPKPRPQAETQLRLGYRVLVILRDEEGPTVAAPWFHGANPSLNEDTPVTAIRELRAAQVVGAAEAFVSQ